MDGWADIRKAAANAHMSDTCCVSWHVATVGFSQLFWLLPWGGFQVSLTFSSCICWGLSNPGRSRYVRFLVLASAIRVVKSTCWTASPPKNWHSIRGPVAILHQALIRWVLFVRGGKVLVWSLESFWSSCVLDTECSKMSKLLISYFLDIYTHNIFIIYILYSI